MELRQVQTLRLSIAWAQKWKRGKKEIIEQLSSHTHTDIPNLSAIF